MKTFKEFLTEDVEQKYTSAATSISQIPRSVKMIDWEPNTINLDYGGGKYDKATEELKSRNVTNLVYDPFNRSSEHNEKVLALLKKQGGADTATINNVLNVIAEPEVRSQILSNVKRYLKQGGVAYFIVYEGDRSGQGKATPRGYQNNLPTPAYMSEIETVFSEVSRKGRLIIAK
jgi:hypothetical protein